MGIKKTCMLQSLKSLPVCMVFPFVIMHIKQVYLHTKGHKTCDSVALQFENWTLQISNLCTDFMKFYVNVLFTMTANCKP